MAEEKDFELIPVNEVPPKSPTIRRGWSRIVQKFIESDHKIAYIQLKEKRQMQLAAAAFNAVTHTWAKGVKSSSHGDLLRVYLEKL